ncbi:MAG: enoyl-ACP reductase [Gemmatimonadota bacterium]
MSSGLMAGKRVLVFGVANERSIAWGVAEAMAAQGARLGFTYAGEVLEKRVRPLAESLGSDLVVQCDVTDDAQVDGVFERVREQWGGLDVLVHSIAYANREELDGQFLRTSREGFRTALDISAYSLVHLTRAAAPMLIESRGNVVTMTYYGARKVVPNYNVMGVAKAALEASVRYLAADLGAEGVRVNAISAGPIKTLAASGVKNFRGLMAAFEAKAPLGRTVTQEEVGRSALFLCSHLGSGVTGQVLYVDSGYSIMA